MEVTWDRDWAIQVNILCKLVQCLWNLVHDKSKHTHKTEVHIYKLAGNNFTNTNCKKFAGNNNLLIPILNCICNVHKVCYLMHTDDTCS